MGLVDSALAWSGALGIFHCVFGYAYEAELRAGRANSFCRFRGYYGRCRDCRYQLIAASFEYPLV